MIHPTTNRAVMMLVLVACLIACANSSDAFRNFFAASRAYCVHAPTIEAIVIPTLDDAGSDASD